jgi:hypothetical protein
MINAPSAAHRQNLIFASRTLQGLHTGGVRPIMQS